MGRLSVVVVLGLLAGGLGAVPRAEAPLGRDVQEVRDYRLSMDVVKKIASVNKTVAASMARDPKRQEIARKKAERAALEAKEEPTDAERERIDALAEEIERLEESAGSDGDNPESISEMARRMDASPELSAALRSAGLTSREYATATFALLQAGLAHGLMKTGKVNQPPDGVSKHNLDFMREHEAEIEALSAVSRAPGSR